MDEIEAIKISLREIPDKIKIKEEELIKLHQEIDETGLWIKNNELKTKIEIVNDKSGDGKPLFSNETKRKGELEHRLRIDPAHTSAINKLNDLGIKKSYEEVNLGYLKRRFRAAEAFSRLGV